MGRRYRVLLDGYTLLGLVKRTSKHMEKIFFLHSISFNGTGFLSYCVDWKHSGVLCIIANVYSPCLLVEKWKFWCDLIMSKKKVLAQGCGLWVEISRHHLKRRKEREI